MAILVCVASVFARVNEQKLEREKKNKRKETERKKGESFPFREVGVEEGENLVRGVHARISVERRSRERGARNEGSGSPVLRLQSRAWSFLCLARFARRTKKERLLVVLIFSLLTNK